MEFYVIIAPPLILSLWMISQLHKMARQDRYLFAERQNLRNLMEPILVDHFNLPKEVYTRLRSSLDFHIDLSEMKELIEDYATRPLLIEKTENTIGIALSPLAHKAKSSE